MHATETKPELGNSIPFAVASGDHFTVRSDESGEVVVREYLNGETREIFRSRLTRPDWSIDLYRRFASIDAADRPRRHFGAHLPLNWVGSFEVNDAAVAR